ncbi:CBM35 domain-containing protein [Streptomyces sp. HNM0663]|uniref:Alpha-galactosidase n=1 Tax=Streptomyces chengmaiensis TaxID=3040919 RepID=A0ABT6HXI3_9ACTN|nr:CBM35 domain-containing protein [Streptomyces chengmaiensis]MDH2393305.1 CBM35 domain-containing protein [Streptomyces chengmaiensis]
MHLRHTRARTRLTALVSSLTLLAGSVLTAITLQVAAAPSATALNNGLGATPQMGWNSWNAHGCNVTEQHIKDAADAIVNLQLKDKGYQYVNIDDCWQDYTRDAQGNLRSHPTRFPSGIKALADYVHARGLKLGIYATPGTATCANFWNGYPGKLGSLGHEQQDANKFAEWGVDYLKYDWCRANLDGVNRETAFKAMRDALQATSRPIFYSIHDEPQQPIPSWRPATANSWRTTSDIRDNWSSMISRAHLNQPLASWAGPGAWNDPDMLEVGNGGMTDAEYRTHFSLWAEMAAPLLMGNILSSASPATLQILGNADVIAVDQDPLGKQGTVVSSSSGLVVMSKVLANGDRAVTLTNETTTTQTISTTAAAVGIGGYPSYTVKDLWTGATSTNTSGTFSASVPSHDTVMYRITPVGSSGAVTIEAEASGNTIAGAARVSSCTSCSGGSKVGYIGNGAANYVTINGVNVSAAGSRTLTISYLVSGTRSFYVSVNGGPDQQISVTGSSWTTPVTTAIPVQLNAGANSIKFHNDTAYAPDLDKITVS